MRIAICTTGKTADSLVSPFLGRCPYFLFVDESSRKRKWEVVDNPAIGARGGAGVAVAQMIASQKAEAVICGGVGPNAFAVLQGAGIASYLAGVNLRAEEALDQFQQGQLSKVDVPTSAQNFGFGPGRGRGRNRFYR